MRARRWVALFVGSCSIALVAGCADGGGTVDAGGMMMMEDDAGTRPRRDSGTVVVSCDTGQHLCGGGCIDDLANDPANGCRLGCGEPCPTPPDGAAGCDEAGACTVDCPPPFTLEGGVCSCTPRTCADMGYECGAPDDGCGTALDCGSCDGGSCIEGLCACGDDDREPNDSRLELGTAQVASIPDVNEWEETYATWTLDSAEDEDWYAFPVSDTGLDNPTIRVTLSAIPEGSNYDLSAYYVCSDGSENSSCSAGSPDNAVGHGCRSASSGATTETVSIDADCSRFGDDDNGTLYVKVTSATWGGSCAPYSITINSQS